MQIGGYARHSRCGRGVGCAASLDLTCRTTTLQVTAQSLAVSVLDLVATRAGEARVTGNSGLLGKQELI